MELGFTVQFVKMFLVGLLYAGPVLIFLIIVIIALGSMIGKREGWSRTDTLYYSFITATTVGYGDFRPTHKASKMIAIAIAFVGLLLTGIFVALGVKAASVAFQTLYQIAPMS